MNAYKVETQAHIDFLLKDIITDVLKNVPAALRVEGDFQGKAADLRTKLETLPRTFPCF